MIFFKATQFFMTQHHPQAHSHISVSHTDKWVIVEMVLGLGMKPGNEAKLHSAPLDPYVLLSTVEVVLECLWE